MQSDGPGLLQADTPAVFELWREEIREPLNLIIEPAAGNWLMTSIEVLSPTYKKPEEGRMEYIRKREEYWRGGVNLVEIDLPRAGDPTMRLSADKVAQHTRWHYFGSCHAPLALAARNISYTPKSQITLRRNTPRVQRCRCHPGFATSFYPGMEGRGQSGIAWL